MKTVFRRYVAQEIRKDLVAGKSVLLLGPRQVGKSTMIRDVIAKEMNMESVLLQDPEQRLEYEQNPSKMIRDYSDRLDVKIIYIDEVQKVPALLDAAQYLIDEKKKIMILTGSSARKLRRQNVNLLPGRVMLNHLDPLMWGELGWLTSEQRVWRPKNIGPKANYSLQEAMVFGTLPEVIGSDERRRRRLLTSYATIYLEEEIRAEALSRNIGSFKSFLELAASESGKNPNFTNMSNQIGMSIVTIREYFAILRDTLIMEELPSFTKNIRRKVVSSGKYYMFDTGVRNALRKVSLTLNLVNTDKGDLFEHVVVLEMMRRKRLFWDKPMKLYYWRTRTGLEVDLILEIDGKIIPIEIKASQNVRLSELRGLRAFMEEYGVDKGYVVTMDVKPQQISDKITALPWNYL